MIYVLFVLLALVIFAKMSDLNNSVQKLKTEIYKIKQQLAEVSTVQSVNKSSSQTSASMQSNSVVSPGTQTNSTSISMNHPAVGQTQIKQQFQPEETSPVVLWLQENWLLKLGVLMILIGFGWFVSYAFMHEWIGPLGRIVIGIVSGTLIAIFGTMRLGKNETQGVLFTILGSALVIMTVLAGQYFYQFFSPMMVLGIVFLISFYISLTALAYSVEKLAIYGLIIALLAPILSHVSVDLDYVSIYLYLLVISISTVWVSVVKGWRLGNPIGIMGILLYSLPIIMGGQSVFYSESAKYITLMVAYIISFLYLAVSAWSLIVKDKQNVASEEEIGATANDVFLTIVSTIIILGFTMSLVPVIYQSLVLALWMLIYGVSGFIVFQTTKNEKLFYIHSLAAILFLAIATSVELSGKTLTIAFAIEVAIISISAFLVTNKIKIAQAFGGLMIVPTMMSLESVFSSNWSYGSTAGVFNQDFFVLFLIGIIWGSLGMFYRSNRTKEDEVADPFDFCHLAIIISSLYFYLIIWLSTHTAMESQDGAVFMSLFIYTVVGLWSYFTGLFYRNNILQKYGAIMLILVVLRLVLVDVWNMELALRVVTFIVLGIMFISTAFISKKQKEEHIVVIGDGSNDNRPDTNGSSIARN